MSENNLPSILERRRHGERGSFFLMCLGLTLFLCVAFLGIEGFVVMMTKQRAVEGSRLSGKDAISAAIETLYALINKNVIVGTLTATPGVSQWTSTVGIGAQANGWWTFTDGLAQTSNVGQAQFTINQCNAYELPDNAMLLTYNLSPHLPAPCNSLITPLTSPLQAWLTQVTVSFVSGGNAGAQGFILLQTNTAVPLSASNPPSTRFAGVGGLNFSEVREERKVAPTVVRLSVPRLKENSKNVAN